MGMEREKAMDAQYILIVYYNYYYIYIYKPQSINKTLIKLEISKEESFFFFFFFTLLYFLFSFTFEHYKGVFFSLPILKSSLLFKL